jgi:hypothetical protein
MSERTLKRILVALAGLVAVYALVRLIGNAGRSTGPDGPLAGVFASLHADTAVALAIDQPGTERLLLARNTGAWSVNGMPADSAAVSRLLDAIRNARVSDVVSTNPQNHDRLGVSADSAVRLTLRSADADSTTLLLGKNTPRGAGNYVRLPDQQDTWEVSGDLRAAAARPLDDFRDKVMVRVDTANVAAIYVQRDTQRFTLRRTPAEWRVYDARARADTAGTPADSLAVANILSELARFEATAFAPDTTTFAGSDQRRVIATNSAGDTLAALEFAGREYIWRARRFGDATLYDAPGFRIDRVAPRRDELQKR